MKTKSRAKSRIFEAVHETAGDLHRLGFIDKHKMRKFDALCVEPHSTVRRQGHSCWIAKDWKR